MAATLVPLAFVAVLSFSLPTQAGTFFSESVFPTNITSGCLSALTANVTCSPGASRLQAGEFYSKSVLDKVCTVSCATGLASFHTSVVSSCQGETWYGNDDMMEPIALISELLRYHYNYTCLSDGSRFCNNVGAAYAVYNDPEAAALEDGLPAGGDYGGYEISDPCDECLVDTLRFQAGSPYYQGPELQESSLYESKTASCGIINAPLTTTTLSLLSATTAIATATPTCTGTVYTVQSSDDCHSVSTNQGIGTAWLLTDNDLAAGCSDFPTAGDLCLTNTCTVYTVAQNDTCKAIAKQYSITEAQLRAWNPSINAGCYNLDQMVDDQICIDVPGGAYTTPAVSALQPSTMTTAAVIPTNAADQSNTYCGQWYEAVLGDYCNLVILKYSISLDDFLFLNPAVNENCTNLFAEESYCVQPVGDLNTYSGQAGYITYTLATQTAWVDSATTLPDIAWSSPTPTSTAAPLATDTRDDCATYINGEDYLFDLDVSDCAFAAEVFGVSVTDLQTWNPSLGNASDPTCTFQTGVRYCGKYFEGDKAVEDDEADWSTVPSRDGESFDCTDFVLVSDVGGPDCATILTDYGLTIAQFYALNPTVNADCSGLWTGYRYCIATNETSATPTSSNPSPTASSTASPSPPGPTQEGQPTNCNAWYLVAAGSDCSTAETASGITHEQFLAWNPAVSSTCSDGFWGGYAYCVGVSTSSTPSTITSSTLAVTSSPSSSTLSPPAPTHPGQPTTCSAWEVVTSGTTCTNIESTYSISHSQFLEWNPAVSSDCVDNYWADYAYCVAVDGAPQPSQEGNAVVGCNRYAKTEAGDWCALFAERYVLDLEEFYGWNTVLGSDGSGCGNMFWAETFYCIGASA